MSSIARMGALTARTAVRSRQVVKQRGDAFWTHKGSEFCDYTPGARPPPAAIIFPTAGFTSHLPCCEN